MMALEHHHFDIPNDYWSEMAANIKKTRHHYNLMNVVNISPIFLPKGMNLNL